MAPRPAGHPVASRLRLRPLDAKDCTNIRGGFRPDLHLRRPEERVSLVRIPLGDPGSDCLAGPRLQSLWSPWKNAARCDRPASRSPVLPGPSGLVRPRVRRDGNGTSPARGGEQAADWVPDRPGDDGRADGPPQPPIRPLGAEQGPPAGAPDKPA